MAHSKIGKAFLERISKIADGPGSILDDVLQVSLDEEQELRKLFAQDKNHKILQDPYVGLVNVFGEGTECIRKTRARVVKTALDTITNVEVQDQDDLEGKHVLPLNEDQRRKEGELSMAADLEEFKQNWSIFTEGSLSQLFGEGKGGRGPWENVVAAGGSVLSALLPLGKEYKKSKKAIRKWYHSKAYPTSDVDLFLWGLTPEQAEKKIVQIYEAVRDSVPWDVTCIRTKHTISFHSQYPYRSVQIVLRLYKSPAEILAGFDIDAPCCTYDGERVWANPRAIVAMMRQANTVDVTRRSPSYEVRLAKYARRGFETYVPNLRRVDIDPTIYERSIIKIEGLARLLVLEKIFNASARYEFLDARRNLRGRPYALLRPEARGKRTHKGDLKADVGDLLEMNDYDVASLHIPYGPGWDARRIEKLVYQTDLGMNSTFNPKNKGRRLHRHPAFFGTVEECMEDCCEHCPEPVDKDERTLQAQEDEKYVRGRLSFIEENAGRQSLSGSFHPIDEGEWSEQVYVRPIDKLFQAIAVHDRPLVQQILKEREGTLDLKHRDHVGRTTLHVAILCKDEDIAWDLIEAGCRMISRLADGRTALHLAVQYGLNGLIEKMLKKSEENKEAAKKEKEEEQEEDNNMEIDGPPDTTTDTDKPSSADDWSSDDNDGKVAADADELMEVEDDNDDDDGEQDGSDEYDHFDDDDDDDGRGSESGEEINALAQEGEVPEDEADEPDVLDIDAGDWDQGLTPLCYAILYSTRQTVDLLLKSGADVNKPAVTAAGGTRHKHRVSFYPLIFTLVRPDEDIAVDIADRLLEAGATSSIANDREGLLTTFHQAIFTGRSKILDLFLRKDPGAKVAVDTPLMSEGNSRFPIVSAIASSNHSALLTLLAHGCKINPESKDVIRAKTTSANNDNGSIWGYAISDYSTTIHRPVETALAAGDEIVNTLVEFGADIDVGTLSALSRHARISEQVTILDWLNWALETLDNSLKVEKEKLDELKKISGQRSLPITNPTTKFKTWNEYVVAYRETMTIMFQKWDLNTGNIKQKVKYGKEKLRGHERERSFLTHVKNVLESKGAKTWEELYGENTGRPNYTHGNNVDDPSNPKPRYQFVNEIAWRCDYSQAEQNSLYEELFQAAFTGNNAKIESLCIPPSHTKTHKSVLPIRITVLDILNKDDPLYGLTPLYAAIVNKQWSTAKLIMGIAAAQYKDERNEEEQDRLRARLFDLVDATDSDDGVSDCSDHTFDVRKRHTNFINIAKNMKVVTDVHPSTLLSRLINYASEDERNGYHTLIVKSIKENDFETFIHLFSLHEISARSKRQKLLAEDSMFDAILNQDNAKFLNELIRRTGYGINVDIVRKTFGDDVPVGVSDQNRLYLGLNIHGKKRSDLARKGDPSNENSHTVHIPILWRAIKAGAKSIVECLSSEDPLEAYKEFAANGSGAKAEWLKHSKNLDKNLSEWLGWYISPLGESPLTAAIIGDRADMLPVLFAKAPQVMGIAVHQKIKFLGHNVLLTAAAIGCKTDMFEALLKIDVSVMECDRAKRWNVYHWLCSKNNGNAIEFLLETLPREVNEQLLAQKSKLALDTPLQIAVKKSYIRSVKLITDYTQSGLLEYDAHGFTPLQNAVRLGHSAIVEALVEKVPEEGLFFENGVGKTPFEDAEKRALEPLIDKVHQSTSRPQKLEMYSNSVRIGSEISEMEKRLEKLVETYKRLAGDGTIKTGEKLAEVFERFISSTEVKLTAIKSEEQLKKEEENKEENKVEYRDYLDYENRFATYEAMAKAVVGKEGGRKLIHLKDVQTSVETDLKLVNLKENVGVDDREELEEEEDDEIKEIAQGMVYQHIKD